MPVPKHKLKKYRREYYLKNKEKWGIKDKIKPPKPHEIINETLQKILVSLNEIKEELKSFKNVPLISSKKVSIKDGINLIPEKESNIAFSEKKYRIRPLIILELQSLLKKTRDWINNKESIQRMLLLFGRENWEINNLPIDYSWKKENAKKDDIKGISHETFTIYESLPSDNRFLIFNGILRKFIRDYWDSSDSSP